MPERQQSIDSSQSVATEPIEPVRKSIRVKASVERAYRAFTEEMDSWWPRTHHIGSSPLTRVVVETRQGGAIYSEQQDGTACPWGSVIAWNPPRHFAMAWHVRPDWTFEPDAAHCSEVHVNFIPVDDGSTLVELEHRYFERHGLGGATMRESVNKEGGWGLILGLFAGQAGGAA